MNRRSVSRLKVVRLYALVTSGPASTGPGTRWMTNMYERTVLSSQGDVDFGGHAAPTGPGRRRAVGKYGPLAAYLAAQPTDTVRLTFEEIEAMLGERLPPSAWSTRWWADAPAGHSHAQAWMSAGWRVVAVERRPRAVTFERQVRQATA